MTARLRLQWFVDAFEAAILTVQQQTSEKERTRRIAVAKENSWESRIERMSGVIEE
ncbi:MAG: hypothetical protein Ct9H300mP25_01670 [Acidobacteriota bacterium]|nr:MAG: hypothetical protein Ct9H300mP25_01670 [Acidobacteriota bacterium]